MSMNKVLAYIQAGESHSPLCLVITELERAKAFGCTLTAGKHYSLFNNGRRTPSAPTTPGYTLLDTKYILQDDCGGMFTVMLLQCQVTQLLGVVLASGVTEQSDLFFTLMASGKAVDSI